MDGSFDKINCGGRAVGEERKVANLLILINMGGVLVLKEIDHYC